MLTEPELDAQIDDWRSTTDYAPAEPAPELMTFQQQILRALAQGAPWNGGLLPLSFQPTPYRVQVKDSAFFAASALECLQLPALLGETIDVNAVCPSNGSAIHLTVTAQGVKSHDPSGCVMSVAVIGQAARDGAGCLVDLRALDRQLTRFFSSAEAAALWLVPYPNVEILQLDRAWHLAAELACLQHDPRISDPTLTTRNNQPDHGQASPLTD